MSRRDRTLAKALDMLQRDLAGSAALEDPFAGVISERAFLYATRSPQAATWGFDGTVGSSARVQVRRDGYSSAHVGACAIAPEEPLHERMIRICNLDRYEADIVRDAAAHPGDGSDTCAARLHLSLRTYQRRVTAICQALRVYRVQFTELAR